jgi:hypothetical protein
MNISEVFFYTAGIAMLAHMALSAVAVRSLAEHSAVAAELFAVPNRPLGTPGWIRLMRVRYFLPFSAMPETTRTLDSGIRGLLWATRLTGFCFACAILGFFISAFVEAGA